MLASLLCLCLVSEGPHVSQNLKTYLDQRTAYGYEPSIVVGMVSPEGTDIYASGFQLMGETKANHASIYEIGSISKVFTALLLMDAVEKGLVALDDPVQKYLPESVKMPTRGGQQITLRHLASHTSSLPRLPFNLLPKDMSNPYADYTIDKLYACLGNLRLTRDIGETYEYSNLGAGLLGHVLELVHKKSYETLVQTLITAPLGMEATVMSFRTEQKPHIAQGYNVRGEAVSHWEIPTLAGAGALRSSVVDMLGFLKLNLGLLESPLVATAKKTHQTQKEIGPNAEVALGWHVTVMGEQRIVWHNGGTGGFRSYIGFDAAKKMGVVVLTNGTHGADDIGVHLLSSEQPLRNLYKTVNLSKAELNSLVGIYQGGGPDLEIRLDGDQLIAQRKGRPSNPIFPASAEKCFYRVADITITFEKDATGVVTGAEFDAFGQVSRYKRKK